MMIVAFTIIAAVVALDQWSKAWVVANFGLYETREIIPGLFSLTYLTNKGAAFGFLNGEHGAWRHIFFISIAMMAMVMMLFMLREMKDEGKRFTVAIALIFGGAAGNLIDRVRQGEVVDFLDFYWQEHHWPAFNIADSGITVGVVIYLLCHLLRAKTNNGVTPQ